MQPKNIKEIEREIKIIGKKIEELHLELADLQTRLSLLYFEREVRK